MPSAFLDDNGKAAEASNYRPKAIAAGIISATLTASTQELTVPTGTGNGSGDRIVRIYAGTQGAFYAFNIASAGASHTGITNMCAMAPSTVEYVRISSTDLKFYVLQLGTAGVVQLTVLE